MEHVGLLCPPTLGHLNPICNIGSELQRRGYRVTLFTLPDVQAKMANSQLEICEISGLAFFPGGLDDFVVQSSKLSGLQALNFTINWSKQATRAMFREAPAIIQEADVDLLLIDQMTIAGGTIADYLQLPFVTVCSALPLNQEAAIPPTYTHWTYRDARWSRLRNHLGYQLLNYLTHSIWQLVQEQRKQWLLPAYRSREDAYSTLAQLCQMPKALDFHCKQRPLCFHYLGSLKSPSGIEPSYLNDHDLPFELLDEKILVYASLGTLQIGNQKIFRLIAEACLPMNLQLVIDLGNPTADPLENNFPGATVLAFAPHQKLIHRANLVITHAGSTVINCLQAGTPMVAIPIANDQPGMAARLARVGACEMLPLRSLSVPKLKICIEKVLSNPSYQNKAKWLSSEIRKSGCLVRAADIIEQVINTKEPVLNTYKNLDDF